MQRHVGLGVLLLLTSCSAPAATPPDAAVVVDAATVDSPAPVDAARADTNIPSTTSTSTIGPITVERGVEQTLCLVVDIGNESPAMIRAIHTHLSPGSHHMIVSNADGEALRGPFPCPAFASGVSRAIFIAQQPESSLIYPDDAGLPIVAHQHVMLEMHMINYFSDTPVDIEGAVDFELASADAGLREVHLMFTGDFSLNLPAHQETTVVSEFAIPNGTEVLAVTSHTHQLGTYASIEIVSSSHAAELVHESRSWADPPLDAFTPPRIFTGNESLRLTCTWLNDTDADVHFGESFDAEMCFLWAYYLDPV